MEVAHQALEKLPADARELAELLATRLHIVTGRLELIYVDGRYVDGYKQERMRPTELADVAVPTSHKLKSP